MADGKGAIHQRIRPVTPIKVFHRLLKALLVARIRIGQARSIIPGFLELKSPRERADNPLAFAPGLEGRIGIIHIAQRKEPRIWAGTSVPDLRYEMPVIIRQANTVAILKGLHIMLSKRGAQNKSV